MSGAAAPGLPDEATLGRLASAFFQALPGTAPPSFDALPTSLGAGSAPAPELSLAQSGPSILPQPVAPDVVDPLGSGGAGFGVPEAYAASLPSVTPPQPPSSFTEALPVSPPATPYYFLGESSAYSQSAAVPAKPENRVVAQSFGLPGEGELKALLADIAGERKAADFHGQPQNPGSFYFLDAAREPEIAPSARPPFDVNAIRRDFPILQERVNGKPLVWFDNAATTQKPQSVIDRIAYFYAHENSNIHRAAHELAARATDAYEAARNKVQRFLGAGSANEIIFVRGATEAINLVAKTWGAANIGAGDEIVVSLLEHHANIVPWQQLAAQVGAKIRVIPVDDTGQLKLDELQKLLNARRPSSFR